MGVLVIDTDMASLIWRDALPGELNRQLLGQISSITFVTLGEALTGAHSGRWNPRRTSGLRAFYEHAFMLLEWDDAIPYTCARLRGQAAISVTPFQRTTAGSRPAASATTSRC